MSERRVRLLYKTDCWQCDDPIDAGMTTWWDDDRRHATCLGCFPERDGLPDGEGMAPLVRTIDLRTLRRLEIVRAHHRSHTLRPNRRPERRPVPVPRTGS
ncbi:MAG TPA: hypothetical protein VIY72_02690 [Acidimicrobiales bacterium]